MSDVGDNSISDNQGIPPKVKHQTNSSLSYNHQRNGQTGLDKNHSQVANMLYDENPNKLTKDSK